jgi:YidC/Oxa1 family membrane protein insertase
MDAKQMITTIVLITAVGLGWQMFLLHEYAIHPEWKRSQEPAVQSASQSGSSNQASPPTSQAAAATSGPSGVWHLLPTTAPAAVAKIGSDQHNDLRYHLGLSISAAGAGINDVTLNQYLENADSPELFVFQDPYTNQVTQTRSMATEAVVVDGVAIPTGDQSWSVTDQTDHSITYAAQIEGPDGKSVVEVDKQFVVEAAQTERTTPQGYEVEVNYSVRNMSPAAHAVSLQFNGPTMPQAETARQQTEVVAGYDDGGVVKVQYQDLGSYNSKNPNIDYVPNEDKLPLVWIGASSNYFNAIVHPTQTGKLASAVALALNPDSAPTDRLVAIHFKTVNFDVSPGAAVQVPLRVFFGPKRRDLLGSSYFGAFPLQYDDTLVMISGFCGLCTWSWLINLLVTLLSWLHWVLFADWGLAIIALVCLVRLILHPITKKSQVSMMAMQKLAPEMERLKKKFGDDKEGFQRAQMDLYKNVGFTPVLGCLPMFFQMPIFIALWRSLQTTFELRQAPFLEFFGHHFSWIHDLSRPDELFRFAHPVPLPMGWSLSAINILPLAMAVVSFINMKYFTPRPAAMSPEQEQQQKMMSWMTLIFPFMFYTFPSGLNLYYLTSTSVGIIESKRIRAHIKRKQDEEAAAGPVIVDAGKPMRSSRRPPGPVQKVPLKKGWLARKLEEIQARADEISRESKKNKPKR